VRLSCVGHRLAVIRWAEEPAAPFHIGLAGLLDPGRWSTSTTSPSAATSPTST
jgi:hypothetical protein